MKSGRGCNCCEALLQSSRRSSRERLTILFTRFHSDDLLHGRLHPARHQWTQIREFLFGLFIKPSAQMRNTRWSNTSGAKITQGLENQPGRATSPEEIARCRMPKLHSGLANAHLARIATGHHDPTGRHLFGKTQQVRRRGSAELPLRGTALHQLPDSRQGIGTRGSNNGVRVRLEIKTSPRASQFSPGHQTPQGLSHGLWFSKPRKVKGREAGRTRTASHTPHYLPVYRDGKLPHRLVTKTT